MSARIFPTAEELPDLVPTPGSIVWESAGDARGFLAAGYALLLQVAHPTVGAGVSEHSNFAADPWGRLLRTLDYVNVTVYGGPEASAQMGQRVRNMHKHIKGVKPDGTRYHALEPQAYAWVHATLAEAIVESNRRFGRRLSRTETERFWVDWRKLGRVVGVRERDLPAGWAGFRDYFDEMVENRLEDTPAVHEVLDSLASPAPPPVRGPLAALARATRLPVGHVFKLSTTGLLPPALRERFGLSWSRAQELELSALAAATRAATPVMPATLRNMGPGYLRWREKQIARGDVASPAVQARLSAGAA